MKKTYKPTRDDILGGFAVSWDGTPQDLTAWKRQFPRYADELHELATEFVRDMIKEREDPPAHHVSE